MGYTAPNTPTRYPCILMDPPWAFRTFSAVGTPHRSAEDHYRTTGEAILASMPVPEMAAKDCALFMWVVDSHIDEAIRVAEAWGFQFKTRAFTWRKVTNDRTGVRIGMGYWTRKQTELCLLFTKGKPSRLSMGVKEIIDSPIREHSRKPDEIYDRIEQLVAGPYLEMFARYRREGWAQWGDQAPNLATALWRLEMTVERVLEALEAISEGEAA